MNWEICQQISPFYFLNFLPELERPLLMEMAPVAIGQPFMHLEQLLVPRFA